MLAWTAAVDKRARADYVAALRKHQRASADLARAKKDLDTAQEHVLTLTTLRYDKEMEEYDSDEDEEPDQGDKKKRRLTFDKEEGKNSTGGGGSSDKANQTDVSN